jgi:hypothetical protein
MVTLFLKTDVVFDDSSIEAVARRGFLEKALRQNNHLFLRSKITCEKLNDICMRTEHSLNARTEKTHAAQKPARSVPRTSFFPPLISTESLSPPP